MIAKLEIGDRLLGALALVGVDPGGARRDFQRLLEHVAPQVGLVIHNAISFEETRQLSVTDPLTELPNRRYLVQHLGLELARADRHASPIAMLLMDVNDFKEINDTLGHKAGDYVLREIGLVARSVLRPYDVCARFGGDEFVLVLWDCDLAQAERRRQQLEDLIGAIEVECSRRRVDARVGQHRHRGLSGRWPHDRPVAGGGRREDVRTQGVTQSRAA
ncbi:MAG: GGDEF domain-containing protein [Vicinamibacterales bacterium]